MKNQFYGMGSLGDSKKMFATPFHVVLLKVKEHMSDCALSERFSSRIISEIFYNFPVF